MVFLNLLVIIRAVGLVVGLLSQPIKGQPVCWTCLLRDRSIGLQIRSEINRISPNASMRSSDLRKIALTSGRILEESKVAAV